MIYQIIIRTNLRFKREQKNLISMKLRNILFTLLLATVFNNVLAADEDINKNTLNNFRKEFANAENIKWTVTGPLTKATFTLNGQEMYAYFSDRGERIALARNIQLTQLPIGLMSDIKGSYKQYWITEAFELSKQNETAYYVAVENADRKVLLKSVGFAGWEIFSVTSKD